MNTLKLFRKLLAVGSFCISIAFTAAAADEVPSFDDLVTNIVKATVPANHYHVIVSQISDKALTNSIVPQANSLVSSAQLVTTQTTYTLHYSNEKGFRTETAQRPEGTNVSTIAIAPDAGDHVSINIQNFLNKIKSWPAKSVIKDTLDGKACYKIMANSKNGSTVFWVDTKHKYIMKVILNIGGHQFSESTLKYQLDNNNGWLLTQVDMLFSATGRHIRLEYGKYDFSTY